MRGHLTALLGAAVLLAGCGSDDEPKGEGIPSDAVTALQQRLDEVQRRFDDGTGNDNVGACNDIENDSIPAIQATVSGLPEDVDPEVRETLDAGIQRLRELVRDGCADVQPAETDTTPEEVTPEPEPEETETEPEQTTTETTPAEPPGQRKKDKENGGGTPPGQDGGGLPAPSPEDDG